jgi:hypothetical protein
MGKATAAARSEKAHFVGDARDGSFLISAVGHRRPRCRLFGSAGFEYGYKPTGVLASLHKFGSLVSEYRKQASETPSLAA